MAKNILITGITGFIGRNVARSIINKKYTIQALVRPSTSPERYAEFSDNITINKIDLADISSLKYFLKNSQFDTIIHIGAIRGGRKFSKTAYFDANVKSTEQFIMTALKNKTKFIFCSSVGVFGATPDELPANEHTTRKNDNYYHYTKIQSENLIQKYVLHGLNAIIIRPSITYGINDFGFPFRLTQLIDKKMLFLPNQNIQMHLTNIELLQQAFKKVLETDFPAGTSFIVADKNPVKLNDLVDFISKELKGKSYPINKTIPHKYFRLGEKIAKTLKNELWVSRFELLSRSWFYDVNLAYKELGLKNIETIPAFKIITNWYKNR